MSALPGPSLITPQTLAALVVEILMVKRLSAAQNRLYCILDFGFCMTYENVTESTEYAKCPYVAHYILQLIKSILSFLNMFLCLMTSCVDH